ncbi:hypothetical protein R1sor_005699 [Riccia sorocarpa]|uniref:Uncharacterized protein n=1 Tax=Riccia sorocarpa TaxID=122646 RepID=A0ABD3HKV6_9MARC
MSIPGSGVRAPLGVDVITKLSNLLPTGTFLTFQALAPLFTNNGECGNVEKVMTAVLLFTFAFICCGLNFTDSVTTTDGLVYYGLVTTKGLFNPNFRGICLVDNVREDDYYYDDADKKYRLSIFDFVNGVLNVIVFGVLSMLTPPVTTCYYPGISNTIVKTVPILAAIFVGSYFTLAPPPRHGLGFSQAIGDVVVAPKNTRDRGLRVDSNKEALLISNDHHEDNLNLGIPKIGSRGNDFHSLRHVSVETGSLNQASGGHVYTLEDIDGSES